MPVAVVTTEAQRYDLKTAPPDGYIMARPLPYGAKLERRDKATVMRMEQEVQRGKRKSRQRPQEDKETQKIELDMKSNWAALHDFSYCITDHNLTDENGAKLDFDNPLVLKYLDPKIGSEIERILSDINDDDEESMEDFTKPPTKLSQVEEIPS